MAEEDEDVELIDFGTLSIMIPEPLAFPRAGYESALEEHARLLAQHESALLFQARTNGDREMEFVDRLAGLIEVHPDVDEVLVLSRPQMVAALATYRGVRRALHLGPGGGRLQVVVIAGGVVSLHTLEIEWADPARRANPRLVVVARDVVVEPAKQKHRQEGPWTITRWIAPDGPRYAWVPTPVEPASDDEAIERVLALYETEARRRLWEFMHLGFSASQAFVQVSSTVGLGDRISVIPRQNQKALTVMYPKITRAIDVDTRPGWVPLFFYGSGRVGLRWIELSADAAERPGAMVQRRLDLHVVPDPPPAAPDPPPAAPEAQPAPRPEPRKRSPEEVLAAIMQMGIDDQIDRLVTLTDAELDREIAEAGFDPAAERALLPGLRERVVAAIARMDLARDPPEPAS